MKPVPFASGDPTSLKLSKGLTMLGAYAAYALLLIVILAAFGVIH